MYATYGEMNNNSYSAYNQFSTKQYVNKLESKYNNKSPQDYYERNLPKSNQNAALAMGHITTRGTCTDKVYDELSQVFYSNENMQRIQKMIQIAVYERTKGKYKLDYDQDKSDLLIAMRAVFLEHARFLPISLVKQIQELNKRVIEYIVPDMITEINQSYNYIKEINEPIKPIARPINVNNAGRRTLPALTSAWGF